MTNKQPNSIAVDIEVRFAETDLMGVVHHAAYLPWFEVGRVAWMKAVGMPYTAIADTGHHLAVTGLNAAYRSSVTFGDTVRVHTWLTKLRSRQVQFTYEIRNLANDAIAVTGVSDHICVDLDGQMAKVPAMVMAKLKAGKERLEEDNRAC